MSSLRDRRVPQKISGQTRAYVSKLFLIVGVLWIPVGCVSVSSDMSRSREASASSGETIAIVEVDIAQTGTLGNSITYTGTTEPVQQVSLRAQTEGQLLNLRVDVGEPVQAGDVLGQLDDDLLQTAVADAEAELAAREFLVTQAQAQVVEAQAQVERAIAELEQAQADAARLRVLADDGAIPEQSAEQAETTARTAEQVVRSAEQQVRTREQAIAAAERRVESQRAILAQTRERLSYATLTSPFSGTVLVRSADPGDFIQSGQEVLQLGDLSEIHVMVQIADRDRSQIQVGQPADIQIDAFPGQTFSGRVSRISPVADTTARLIPVEITLSNPDRTIGSGLIARVNFAAATQQSVIVPQNALTLSETESPGDTSATLFVLVDEGDQSVVQPRQVMVGDRTNGQVEILSGLESGEAYVIRSDSPLTEGQIVQRSILSES